MATPSSSPASGSGCEGIDAPELHQTCTAYGQPWACGRTSAEWLREHLNGRQVECVGHARDRYGRLLAVCYVGGESINERIVREGWALDLPALLDGLRAGRGGGQARRRRDLARRVHAALGVARSRIVGANRPATLAGYAAGMDTDIDVRTDDPLRGLVLLMRIFWGPMFWPIIIGNVMAYLWCVYQVLA